MKLFVTWLFLALMSSGANRVHAQLEALADQEPQYVFGGNRQTINVLWHNPRNTACEADIQTRTMQLTSATAALVDGAHWKTLQVLPGQTVVETAALDFPAVKAETRFLVQWIDDTNHVLGSTEVLVYPTNLLSELQPLVGKDDGALGVFDPQNEIKPLLKIAEVDFLDLGNTVQENFRGRLAIIGPFESKAQIDSALAAKIKIVAAKGVAVIWIQAPPKPACFHRETEKLQPSFYSVPENQTAAVIVQSKLVDDLSSNPRSQLNLIYFCKLALHPQPMTLPFLTPQP